MQLGGSQARVPAQSPEHTSAALGGPRVVDQGCRYACGCGSNRMQAKCKHAERVDSRSPGRRSRRPATSRRGGGPVTPAVPHQRTLTRRPRTDARRGDGTNRRAHGRPGRPRDRCRRSPRRACATVIVIDASVLANVVGDDEAAGALARDRLQTAGSASAPDLVDVETVSVLRRRWLNGDLTDDRFHDAIADLLTLPISRFPTGPLMPRAFELRASVTAYDACYVALAEALECTLVTADQRLASAPTIRCSTDVLRG